MEKETGPVFDYPANRTEVMTAEQLDRLTSSDIPGKVVLEAIWFLEKWNREEDIKLRPEKKRPAVELVADRAMKRRRLEQKRESSFITVETMDELEKEEPSPLPTHFAKKTPETISSESKATKADDAGVPVYKWDDRIMETL